MNLVKIVAFGLCFFAGYTLPVQGQGVDFRHISFAEALGQAKADGKMVFMDCYTSWCGPCKYMAEQVFTLEKAGAYFNPKYINIKVDMEKGEGKELAERYGVQAFPTFLLINAAGQVKGKVEGAGQLDEFISRLEKAQDEKSSVAYWDKLYESRKLDRKGKLEYLKILAEARLWEKVDALAGELLKGLSDKKKCSPDYWTIFNNQSLSPFQSPNFLYLVNHKATFEKNIGTEVVGKKVYNMYNRWVMSHISGVILGKHEYRQSQMDSVRSQLGVLDPERKHELEVKCRLAELRNNKECKEMIQLLRREMQVIPQKDLWDVATAFIIFGKDNDADYYQQLGGLGKQFEECAGSPELKGYMHNFFAHYARLQKN